MNLTILENEYVAAGLALFLGVYAYTASRMRIPEYLRNLFNNNIFRIVFLSLLLTQNLNKSPHIAITIAFLFVITLHYIGEQEIKENFAYLEAFKNSLKRGK